MSIAAISYKSLNNAAGEAKDVSKKLNKYASELNNTVYKKLNSYKGSWTSNLSSAKNSVHAKISQLENAADDYDDYSENLKELRDECKRVDKSVKSRVSKLTSQFKKNNGIRDSKIENAISFHLTKFGNSTSAGRWLGSP